MISNLIESIYKCLTEDTDLLSYVDGLYYMTAPQGTDGTYCTFHSVSNASGKTMGGNVFYGGLRYEEALIQFNVWTDDTSPISAVWIAENICGWLENRKQTIAGHTHVDLDRQSFNVLADPDGGWQIQFDYLFTVDAN